MRITLQRFLFLSVQFITLLKYCSTLKHQDLYMKSSLSSWSFIMVLQISRTSYMYIRAIMSDVGNQNACYIDVCLHLISYQVLFSPLVLQWQQQSIPVWDYSWCRKPCPWWCCHVLSIRTGMFCSLPFTCRLVKVISIYSLSIFS